MQRNQKMIVVGLVAVLLLTGLIVGIVFLVKKLKKSDTPKKPEKPKVDEYKRTNNGAASCQAFCTNSGGNWGTKYNKAVSAVISGPGGTFNGRTLKHGEEISVNDAPGAIYPAVPGLSHYEPDQSKPAYFALDCGCAN